MAINSPAEIEWAPKVSLAKIRTRYLRESQGIFDEELIEEVGTSLYSFPRASWKFRTLTEGMCGENAAPGLEPSL